MCKVIVAFIAVVLSGTVYANYSCTGPVVGVSVNAYGNVISKSMAGISWVYLCNVGLTYNNVSPDACKAMFSELLTAETSGQPVTLWFNDNLTCSTHPAWTWLSGWYLGPALGAD